MEKRAGMRVILSDGEVLSRGDLSRSESWLQGQSQALGTDGAMCQVAMFIFQSLLNSSYLFCLLHVGLLSPTESQGVQFSPCVVPRQLSVRALARS